MATACQLPAWLVLRGLVKFNLDDGQNTLTVLLMHQVSGRLIGTDGYYLKLAQALGQGQLSGATPLINFTRKAIEALLRHTPSLRAQEDFNGKKK